MAGITRGFGKEIRRRYEPGVIRGAKSTLTDLSVLDHLYNLTCDEGHRSYSPESERWFGLECGARTENGACASRLKYHHNELELVTSA